MKIKQTSILLLCLFSPLFLRAEQTSVQKLQDTATFAGGCFWCMQPPFDELDGVLETTVGYTGGKKKNPSYKQVSYGKTDHLEAIQVRYDPTRVSYNDLLDVFWQNIDPTDDGGQFADRGDHYRTAVFYHNKEQREQAKRSKTKLGELKKFKKPVVTEIRLAGPFYAAEKYHQKYYQKNPKHYKRYKIGSGRAGYIKKMWGDSSKVKNE